MKTEVLFQVVCLVSYKRLNNRLGSFMQVINGAKLNVCLFFLSLEHTFKLKTIMLQCISQKFNLSCNCISEAANKQQVLALLNCVRVQCNLE